LSRGSTIEDPGAGALVPAPEGLVAVQAFALGRARRIVMVACAVAAAPPPLREIPALQV
jgi:hypothetical protein